MTTCEELKAKPQSSRRAGLGTVTWFPLATEGQGGGGGEAGQLWLGVTAVTAAVEAAPRIDLHLPGSQGRNA